MISSVITTPCSPNMLVAPQYFWQVYASGCHGWNTVENACKSGFMLARLWLSALVQLEASNAHACVLLLSRLPMVACFRELNIRLARSAGQYTGSLNCLITSTQGQRWPQISEVIITIAWPHQLNLNVLGQNDNWENGTDNWYGQNGIRTKW